MACTDVPVELGNMSPHLAEAMLVVEDMPILKRINVMVGITRSKVILVVVHLYDFVWEISALGLWMPLVMKVFIFQTETL